MNFKIVQGDIFRAKTDIITNPTNSVGVMGAGLAKKFYDNADYYRQCLSYNRQCQRVQMNHDKPILLPPKLYEHNIWYTGKTLCQFPTKIDWRDPSDIMYIITNLDKLLIILDELKQKKNKVHSIAFPLLGCGLGGLDAKHVTVLIEDFATKYKGEVELYV